MRLAPSILAALVIGGATSKLHAQKWPQEPEAVLGVKLGAPIQDSPISRCSSPTARNDEPCLEKEGGLAEAPARFSIHRHAFPYAEFTAIVDDTGIVSQVIALMNQSKFAEFSAVLLERYGPAASAEVVQWQSRAGTRFLSRELTWSGTKVRIIAMERGHALDRSVVSIQDIAAADREQRKARDKAKGAASKL